MKRFRFAWLLASLVLVVFVRPFLSERVGGVTIIDVLLFVSLMAGAYAAIAQRRWFVVVAGLGGLSAVTQIWLLVAPSTAAGVGFLVVGQAFYGAVAWSMARALFSAQQAVTRDTLYQALSVYLLLGLVGAMAYALLELAAPGSFRFAADVAASGERFDRFLGFSFTTLTTLGYGNVAPATPRADALATLQAVLGQLYIAVVIARLVAIEVGQRQHRAGDGQK